MKLLFTALIISFITFSMLNISSSKQNPQYQITVSQNGKEIGKIVVETYPEKAPQTAHNFDSLVSVKFYDGTVFHRIIAGFMIQGGGLNSKIKLDNKKSWGMTDASQAKVNDEFKSGIKHTRGTLSMAHNSKPNSSASQFFIMHDDNSDLDGGYSSFGKVISGIEVVDAICKLPLGEPGGECPIDRVEMKIVKLN